MQRNPRFTMPSQGVSPSSILDQLYLPLPQGNFITANRPSATQNRFIQNSQMNVPRMIDEVMNIGKPNYAEVIGGITGMGIKSNGADPSGRYNAYGGDTVEHRDGTLKRRRYETDEAVVTGPVLPSALPSSDSSSSSSSGSAPPQILVPVIVKIDSDQRDQNSYTLENSYKINFPTVDNVVRARIIEAVIPNAQYNIHAYTKNIYFTEKNTGTGIETDYTATMTIGNYDTTTLPTEVARAMNAAVNLTFTCTYNDITEHLTITRGDGLGTFKFKWATNAASNLSAQVQLGFSKADSSSFATSQTSDKLVQLSGPNYIELEIDEFSTLGPSSKSMATFQLDQATGYACFNTMTSQVRCFRTPTRFSTITARFYNPISVVSGKRNPFEFNGTGNCFSIEFLTLQS